jgi:hypothetical protein
MSLEHKVPAMMAAFSQRAPPTPVTPTTTTTPAAAKKPVRNGSHANGHRNGVTTDGHRNGVTTDGHSNGATTNYTNGYNGTSTNGTPVEAM